MNERCKSCETRRRAGLEGQCPACSGERTRAEMATARAADSRTVRPSDAEILQALYLGIDLLECYKAVGGGTCECGACEGKRRIESVAERLEENPH